MWTQHPEKCFDAWFGSDNVGNNGTQMNIWDCGAGNTNQQYIYDPSKKQVQWVLNRSKCLDVNAGSTDNGTKIQLWDCNDANTNQKFDLNNGKIVWNKNPNKCLDVSAGNNSNGNHVQLWDCIDGNTNQVFQFST
jgi:hypothetical protein